MLLLLSGYGKRNNTGTVQPRGKVMRRYEYPKPDNTPDNDNLKKILLAMLELEDE
jgi:hypothetical protein